MFIGKVGQACKFVDNSNAVVGVHKVSDEIKQILAEKHPHSEDISSEALLPVTKEPPNPVNI